MVDELTKLIRSHLYLEDEYPRSKTLPSGARNGFAQAATLAQTRIILGPVRHLEIHLADVMTASGVMFVRHG